MFSLKNEAKSQKIKIFVPRGFQTTLFEGAKKMRESIFKGASRHHLARLLFLPFKCRKEFKLLGNDMKNDFHRVLSEGERRQVIKNMKSYKIVIRNPQGTIGSGRNRAPRESTRGGPIFLTFSN